MTERDDTAYVQGFIGRGEPVPPGEWSCPGGVTLPAGYAMQVAAITGREPPLTSGPGFLRIGGDTVIRWRYPAPKMKATILSIGTAWPHEPDEFGGIWSARDWHFGPGDFPSLDGGLIGGWTPAELALLSDVARVAGQDKALELAERYRAVPA